MNKKNIDDIMLKYVMKQNIILEQNKKILIESFVKYYGEQHRNYIASIIENIKFYQFFDQYTITEMKAFLKKYSKEILKKATKFKCEFEKIKYDFQDFYLLDYEEQARIIKKIISDSIKIDEYFFEEFEILDNYNSLIGKDLEFILDISKIIKYYYNLIDDESIYNKYIEIYHNRSDIDKEESENLEEALSYLMSSVISPLAFHCIKPGNDHFIYFHTLLMSDKDLIHEINHAITSTIITLVGDEGYIKKTGLSISKTNGSPNIGIILEEVINDLSAIEITRIFHKLGGKLSIKSIFSNFGYDHLHSIVNKFYEKYKEILKEVRITENQNLLYSIVDKKIYKEYEYLIYEYHCIRNFISDNKNQEKMYAIDDLVEKMNKVESYENTLRYI